MVKKAPHPPRPLHLGDIVVAYSEALGEWTAAQVTDLDATWGSGAAGVLDLEWSGPEPTSIEDLGALLPLRLTHHSYAGSLSHCNFDWLLPRGCRVLGNPPLLHGQRRGLYGSGWRMGDQLARQRRWDRGGREVQHSGERTFAALEFADLGRSSTQFPDVWSVTITGIESIDAGDVTGLFPNLATLALAGNLGTLTGAGAFNHLRRLKSLSMFDLYGMGQSDCLLPANAPRLEALNLHGVPAEYAQAMKKTWSPEVKNGTFVDITKARTPEWVAENRDNPLRGWDGREHISAARYRKALAQYKTTRRAVIEALVGPIDATRLEEIGREYAEAFNVIDGRRNPFIETVERDELFDALNAIVEEAESAFGHSHPQARERLIAGFEAARDW